MDIQGEHNNKGDWFICNEWWKRLSGVIFPSHVWDDCRSFCEGVKRNGALWRWLTAQVDTRDTICIFITSEIAFFLLRSVIVKRTQTETHTRLHTWSAKPQSSAVSLQSPTRSRSLCKWQLFSGALWDNMAFDSRSNCYQIRPNGAKLLLHTTRSHHLLDCDMLYQEMHNIKHTNKSPCKYHYLMFFDEPNKEEEEHLCSRSDYYKCFVFECTW